MQREFGCFLWACVFVPYLPILQLHGVHMQGTKIADACQEAGVRAFPTWSINGKTIEGELSLEELEKELGN